MLFNIYRVNMLFAHPPPASESVEVEQTDAVSTISLILQLQRSGNTASMKDIRKLTLTLLAAKNF